jgi:hypothetical protein
MICCGRRSDWGWEWALTPKANARVKWCDYAGSSYSHDVCVEQGVNNTMVSFIEVFLLAAIFGLMYAMLQLASR